MRVSMKRMSGVMLSVAALTALAACSSSGSSHAGGSAAGSPQNLGLLGQYGHVPAESTATPATGTITVASPPQSAATWILPIVTGATNSVYTVEEFDWSFYRPLYWLVNGVQPEQDAPLSMATMPVWTNNDQTLTFTMKSNYKWSDGQPVTSQDVVFWYYLLKAALKQNEANWADYTPGLGLPDEVKSISAPNASTVVMNLTKSVNPEWFTEDELGTVQAIPEHAWDIDATGGPAITDWATNPVDAGKIYSYLAKQSASLTTYASNPLWQVVDGPYKLTSYEASSGAFTMAPNAAYGGPKGKDEENISVEPFTSDDAEFNAIKAGKIDIGYVPLTDVPQVSTLTSSYNTFGYSDFGWSYVDYNFADTTGDFNNIIGQLYVRQALAHLENEPGYIKAFFYGAGGQGYGPVPQVPVSPYTPANAKTDPYPYDPSAAAALLKANGWNVVPNGTDTCAKAGTAAGDCGAGIPAGTKLEWNVIVNTSPAIIGEQVEDWASEAKTVGITMNLATSSFNTMIQDNNDPSSPKTINKWAMSDFGGFNNSTYPTTFGVFNTGASSNLGLYDSAQATSLITASISSPNVDAVTAEASYLTTQQPGLFQPNQDDALGTAGILAWSKNVSGPPQYFEALTQANYTPEFWFLTK
jgi:peptide/nickel transport system substrate-binding protein